MDISLKTHCFRQMLKASQRKFGLARFEMGVLLCHIKDDELWKGQAESFTDYLHQERINRSAANQYMRVARKLYFEMKFTDEEFESICDVSMTTLDKACAIINSENREEVLAMMTSLESRDARFEIEELQESPSDRKKQPKNLAKVLNAFRDLPHEHRIAFMQQLNIHNGIARRRD